MKYIYNNSYFIDKILQMNDESINEILNSKEEHYYPKFIKKKQGFRKLNCIEEGLLKVLQNNLKKNFLNYMPIPDYVYGFVKNSSYKDFLIPHLGQSYYLRVDIKDFFSSIEEEHISEAFLSCFRIDNISEKNDVLEKFSNIVTLNGVLPQGALTSPIVSNVVFRQTDIRIKYYCDKLGVTYTRYADDLLFSSKKENLHHKFFIKKISYILNSKNFKLNTSKTLKYNNEITLNGFIVGEKLRFSRKRKNDLLQVMRVLNKCNDLSDAGSYIVALNKLNLQFKKKNNFYDGNNEYFNSKNSVINYLLGFRSFYIDWIRTKKMEDEKDLNYIIKKIEKLVYKLS